MLVAESAFRSALSARYSQSSRLSLGHVLLDSWCSTRALNANFYYGMSVVLGASLLLLVFELTSAALLAQAELNQQWAAREIQRACKSRRPTRQIELRTAESHG